MINNKITKNWQIYTDGGSRGNPGEGAVGAVIIIGGEKITISERIGICTNNQAEYIAVEKALEKITSLNNFQDKQIEWFLDSELVVKQLNGQYKIKNEKLKKINQKIHQIIYRHNLNIIFKHVLRSQNKEADRLVNLALDQKQNGYTFIEMLISSIIFVSVITIAAAGFAQIVKYRATVNAQLEVNQNARLLVDTITNDIRNADMEKSITVNIDSSTFFNNNGIIIITKYQSNVEQLPICNISDTEYQIDCNPSFNRDDIVFFIALKDKVKAYRFTPNIIQGTYKNVGYKEYSYGLSDSVAEISGSDISNSPSEFKEFTSSLVQINKLTLYQSENYPVRLEFSFTVASQNWNNSNVRDYEKSILTIATEAMPRNQE